MNHFLNTTSTFKIRFRLAPGVGLFIAHKKFTAVFCMLFMLLLSPMVSSGMAEKQKAADLVEDGQAIDTASERYQKLFTELQQEYQFSKEELQTLFAAVAIDKRVLELMDRQWEAKPYYKYSPLFITSRIIATGKKKLQEHADLLRKIEAHFGVNKEIVVAIWGIESRFGTHSGSFSVFQTLNTLFDAYPRRSAFFRKQLIYFLLVCRENGMNPLEVKGSYAGAFGQTQFIPSSFHEYAVSFDDDQTRDIFNSTEDILASIANYLKRFGYTLNTPVYIDIGSTLNTQELIDANEKGRKAKVDYKTVSESQGIALPTPPGNKGLTIVGLERAPSDGDGYRYVAGYPNFQAITEWNHSNRYAMAVAELAEAIRLE